MAARFAWQVGQRTREHSSGDAHGVAGEALPLTALARRRVLWGSEITTNVRRPRNTCGRAWPSRLGPTRRGAWDEPPSCRRPKSNRDPARTNTRLSKCIPDPGEEHDLASQNLRVVAELESAYDTWWNSVQPQLVNEDDIGPKVNPFKELYWAQFGKTVPVR
jgi:hypothetical protein